MSDWTNQHVSDFAKNIRGDFSQIPRFGHSKHIELLVSLNKKDQRNYIDGVVSFVILILSLVVLWTLSLVYFRCRGSARWGCLAGQFTYKDEKSSSRGFLRRALVWILFLISGIIIIVSPFVLIRSAYPKIHSAAINTRILNQSVKGLLSEGYAKTNSTMSIEDTLNITNLTQTNVRSFCGTSFNETAFLSSLNYNATAGISFLTKGRRLANESILDNIAQGVTAVQDYLNQSDTKQVRSLLSTGLNASNTLDHILHEFLNRDWIIKMFALFLIAIVIIMIVLGLLNICGKNPCFFHFVLFWLILPSFVLFIFFSWALALLVTVAAVMNSDVCFGGQNKTAVSTALAALKLRGQGDGKLYNTILYYDSSCNTSSPWVYLSNYTQQMDKGTNASMVVLLSNISAMTEACGQDISPFLVNLAKVKPLISGLQQNLHTSMELASCSRVYPLFNQTFNGSLCQENMDGLDLSSVLLFCIAVFGLFAITLRSSLYVKKILSVESGDDKPSSIVVQGNIPKEETPPPVEPKSTPAAVPSSSIFSRKNKRSQAKGVSKQREIEAPNQLTKDTADHVPHIYSEPGESEEFEVMIDGGHKGDDFSEISDPSKIGIVKPNPSNPIPPADGNHKAESESKLSRFFKKQSTKS